MQGAAGDTSKAADRLYRTREETSDELQKGMEVAKEDIQSAMETFKEEVSKITEAAALASSSSPKKGTYAQGSMV